VGRTDLLRGRGLTYRELEHEGLRLPVIETHARFLRPAFYDDTLEIRTELQAVSGARVTLGYEVHRPGTEGPLATASTSHAAVDPKGRPRRLPQELRRRLERRRWCRGRRSSSGRISRTACWPTATRWWAWTGSWTSIPGPSRR